ncbi:MAG: glycosyltransferase family 4 protein [Crocinitomicaceae bacterium]|nr:glycosyltransferase family 4 protein [Crocinitomicaceae bacterium]
MKVLFLTDGIFPFQLGGMQKHSLILCQLLLKKGVDVHLIHCGGSEYSREKLNELFPAFEGKLIETIIQFPKTDPFPGHYVRENKKYSKLIYEAVRSELANIDIIYSQGYTAWYFLKKKDSFKAPVLVNFHGYEMFQFAPDLKVKMAHKILRPAVKTIIKKADGIYSFGGQIDSVISSLGVDKKKILHQSNGINQDWIRKDIETSGGVRKFVFIGRNERRKGIEELNEAIKLFLNNDINAEFSFIGPIEQIFKDQRIQYLGELRDVEQIKQVIDESDCLVCPSHSEGMPTVILEAMARGLAIIATDVGAVSRMINGNGILLKNADPTLIASALKEIVELPVDQLNEMKLRSIELVRNQFLWEKIVEDKIQQFKDILESKD